MSTLATILLTVGGSVLGVVFTVVYSNVRNRWTNKRELNDNDNIDVTGDWFCAWQTTVNAKALINSEASKMEQNGKTVKFYNTERAPENLKGGYLWEAEMHFYHGKSLMGWYFPKKEENNSSKGIMYFTYSSQRKIFLGKWVGANIDGDLVSGLVVVAQDRDKSKTLLTKLCDRIKNYPENIVFNNLYEIDNDE